MIPAPSAASPAVDSTATAGNQLSKINDGEEQGDQKEENEGVIDENNDAASEPKTWWGQMMDKLESFKEWAGEFIQSKTDNEASK